jgi:hypothetical protein
MAQKNVEQGGSAPPAPDKSDNSLANKVMNHLSDTTERVIQKSRNPNFAAMMGQQRWDKQLPEKYIHSKILNAGSATMAPKPQRI